MSETNIGRIVEACTENAEIRDRNNVLVGTIFRMKMLLKEELFVE